MEKGHKAKRNVTAKQAIEMLRRKGIVIDERRAEEMLELFYFLVELVLDQEDKK